MRRPAIRILFAAVVLAASPFAVSSPAHSTSPAPVTAARTNLILITLDTTRADHLGCYGAKNVETPALDRIAREGTLVENAIATAPLTLPAHASLLTGLYPAAHGARDNGDFRLSSSVKTLAGVLHEHGFATGAVVASVVLSKSQGLDRGFDSYDEPAQTPLRGGADHLRFQPIVDRKAAEVTTAALAAIDRWPDRRFFLWIHYYDPHEEYDPPEPFASRYRDRPYDGEIASVDAQIARLLDELTKRGLPSPPKLVEPLSLPCAK